jgi:hypothetical protein
VVAVVPVVALVLVMPDKLVLVLEGLELPVLEITEVTHSLYLIVELEMVVVVRVLLVALQQQLTVPVPVAMEQVVL